MNIRNILLGMLFLSNSSLLATQKKVTELVNEHPSWSCNRIAELLTSPVLVGSTKLSIAAVNASGPFAIVVAPLAVVTTLGVAGVTHQVNYEACLGIKKEIAEQQKKGRFTWKGFYGDDFDWAGN